MDRVYPEDEPLYGTRPSGGCCGPNDAKSRSLAIDKILKEDAIIYRSKIKLLLLGPGESGKSTIAKQMRIIHQSGFTEEEKTVHFKQIIFRNIIDGMKTLLEGATELGIKIQNPESTVRLNEVPLNSFDLTPSLAEDIKVEE